MIASTPEGYITAAEAATRLGVPRRTLERWCATEKIADAQRQEWNLPGGHRWLVPLVWVRNAKRRGPGRMVSDGRTK